jgi:hypothetical protein
MSPFDDEHEDPDPGLAQLLRAANPPLTDAGFSARVLRRVRRRARLREAVLAAAAVSGLALALVPASRLLVGWSEQLVVASLQWSTAIQRPFQRLPWGAEGADAPRRRSAGT